MTLVEDSERVSKWFSNGAFLACQSIIYDRCNRANIVHLEVDYLFFLTLNIFSLPSTIIASAKKESQYGTKILVIFTTIAKLAYKHAAGEYY